MTNFPNVNTSSERFAGWVREAEEAALKKANSAHPRNRRVRTGGPSNGAEFPPLWRYVRGTCVVIGSLKVSL